MLKWRPNVKRIFTPSGTDDLERIICPFKTRGSWRGRSRVEGTFVQNVHGEGKALKFNLETRVPWPKCQKDVAKNWVKSISASGKHACWFDWQLCIVEDGNFERRGVRNLEHPIRQQHTKLVTHFVANQKEEKRRMEKVHSVRGKFSHPDSTDATPRKLTVLTAPPFFEIGHAVRGESERGLKVLKANNGGLGRP